jgi:hypothetical protein
MKHTPTRFGDSWETEDALPWDDIETALNRNTELHRATMRRPCPRCKAPKGTFCGEHDSTCIERIRPIDLDPEHVA